MCSLPCTHHLEWTSAKERPQIYTLFHNLVTNDSNFLLKNGEKHDFFNVSTMLFLIYLVSYLLISKRLKEKRLLTAVSLIIVLTPLGYRGMINCLNLWWSPQSVLPLSTDYSDVLGVGIILPRLVVNVHPASAHALNGDCLAINFNLVSVDCGDGHFGGSVSSPPFNQ